MKAPPSVLDEPFRCLLNAVDELHGAVTKLYDAAAPEEEGR